MHRLVPSIPTVALRMPGDAIVGQCLDVWCVEHLMAMSVQQSKYRKIDGNLFQRDDADFDKIFKPFIAQSLRCDLSTVTNAGEFTGQDIDLFEFDKEYLKTVPNSLPTLALAAKLATAIALSNKWLYAVGSVVQAIHSVGGTFIKRCECSDVERMRVLLLGGFHVVIGDGNMFGAYSRKGFTQDPRRVELSANFIKEIELCTLNTACSVAARKEKLRQYAVLAAVTLVHECGGHALHTMMRPDYFYIIPGNTLDTGVTPLKIEGTDDLKISPPRILLKSGGKSEIITDFGTMCELVYFHGGNPGMLSVDPLNLDHLLNMKDLVIMFPSFCESLVIDTVSTEYFRAQTYAGDGEGLFFNDIKGYHEEKDLPRLSSSIVDERNNGPKKLQVIKAGAELTTAQHTVDQNVCDIAVVDPAERLVGCGRSTSTWRP